MPEITVAMINTDCLKLKPFAVNQQEIELEIQGDTDPNTLQRLRDHVFASVQHHRQLINKFIKDKNEEIKKQPSKPKAQQLTKTSGEGLEKLLRVAEKKIQASAVKFFEKDNETAAALRDGQIKLAVKLLWTPVAFLGGALAFGVAPATGGAGWALALKFWADAVKDLYGWLANIKEAYAASKVDLEQLEKAIQTIRSIKPPKTIEATHIDNLKMKTKAYSARILGLEMETKKAAQRLDALLQAQDKVAAEIKATGKRPPKKSIDDTAELVKDQIALIEKLNQSVVLGKKRVQSAKDHADNAAKRAREDWSGWLGKLGKLYEFLSSGLDIYQDLKVTAENAFTASKYIGGLVVDKFTEN